MKNQLLLLFLVFCFTGSAQNFEEEFLNKLDVKTKKGLVSGLILQNNQANTTMANDIVHRIDGFLADYKKEKFSRKSIKKQVDIIFKAVHKEFFKKYEEIATFDQIFETGTYNCVSGSALYAIIFDDLGINYEIVSQPGHVYLIADPNDEKISVECTDPVTGSNSGVTDRAKKSYVQQMFQYKMIAPDDYPGMSEIEIYAQLMSDIDQTVPPEALIAYQYYNCGSELMGEQAYVEALNKFKKGNQIYEDEIFKAQKLVAYFSLMQESSDQPLVVIDYFLEMAAMADSLDESQKDDVASVACEAFDEYFIVRDYPDSALVAFRKFRSSFSDQEDLLNNIRECFLLSKMRWGTYKENEEVTILCASAISHYQPRNLELKNILKEARHEIAYMNLDSLSDMLTEGKREGFYPEEITFNFDEIIEILKIYKKVEDADFSYIQDLTVFETRYTPDLVEQFDSRSKSKLELAYLEAWREYFKKKDYTNAYKIAERGLKYFPDSAELKTNAESSKGIALKRR